MILGVEFGKYQVATFGQLAPHNVPARLRAEEGCRYPKSTDESWMGERPEWPFPVFEGDFGALI